MLNLDRSKVLVAFLLVMAVVGFEVYSWSDAPATESTSTAQQAPSPEVRPSSQRETKAAKPVGNDPRLTDLVNRLGSTKERNRGMGKVAAKQPPLALDELLALNPLVAERFQDGLLYENEGVLQVCVDEFSKTLPESTEQIRLDFELIVELKVDAEIGRIGSVGFVEPDTIDNDLRSCLSERLLELTFDGAEVAFEGPIAYPVVVLVRPTK